MTSMDFEAQLKVLRLYDNNSKFMYMLSAGGDIAELVAKFSYDNLP